MPSYYEVLKLESNAAVAVIEAAIDDQYNQFRRLINHHDPNVVEQANRALRQLEDIRSTLTNPEKRALYDQTLVGGLVDPNAILQSMGVGIVTMTPPPPQTASQDDPRVYAWKCSQCGTANRIDSTTCSNCGTIIARECPNGCGSVVRLSERYCSKCGKSVEEGLAKMQLEFEQAQKQFCDELKAEIQLKRSEIERLDWFSKNAPLSGTDELSRLVGQPLPGVLVSCEVAAGLLMWSFVWGGCLLWAFSRRYWGLDWTLVNISLSMLVVGCMMLLYFQARARKTVRTIIGEVLVQREEAIRREGHRLQEEQAKQFDPVSPKPYSPSTDE